MENTPVIVLLLAGLTQVLGVPDPVSNLVAAAYTGNWYQVYTNNYALTTSQRNATCTTVNYGFLADNMVSVDNRFRQYTGDGMELQTTGVGTVESAGVLSVEFENIPGTFSYLIVKLGPLTSMRQYSYSVVTDESGTSLYVLARSVSDFMTSYKDEVLTFLETEGFTGQNAPVETMHMPECMYPGLFSPPTLVPELDVPMYMGRWYLAYNNLNIDNRVSKNSKCSTVEYGQVNATTLSVANVFRSGSPTGLVNTTGTGYALTTADPAVLAVYFYAYPGLVFDYRVVKLGPVKDGQYVYTIDTDRGKSSIFVMVRDLEEFEEYEEEVMEYLDQEGFNGPTSSPLKQYHGADCLYPDGFEYTGPDTDGASRMHFSAMFASLLLVISALWTSM